MYHIMIVFLIIKLSDLAENSDIPHKGWLRGWRWFIYTWTETLICFTIFFQTDFQHIFIISVSINQVSLMHLPYILQIEYNRNNMF